MDKFSNQVFGCDICQTVCPWNRLNLIETVSDKQENLIPLEEMDRLMNLNQQEFNDLYGSTPVSRVKRVGFIRNILIARHHLHSTGQMNGTKICRNQKQSNLIQYFAPPLVGSSPKRIRNSIPSGYLKGLSFSSPIFLLWCRSCRNGDDHTRECGSRR